MNFVKTINVVLGLLLGGGSLLLTSGCDNSESGSYFKKAAQFFLGESKSPEEEHEVPLIVQEQQRKEIIRRNTEWTAENQRLHPAEYCAAMLEDLGKKNQQLEVAIHQVTININKFRRQQDENAAKIEKTQDFLNQAKAAYREADAANQWPMTVNGFSLTREKAQERIVEADSLIRNYRNDEAAASNQLAKLEARQKSFQEEQKKLVLLKDRLNETINNLRAEDVFNKENDIDDALNALNDSIKSLDGEYGDVSLDELIQPTATDQRQKQFEAIMQEL